MAKAVKTEQTTKTDLVLDKIDIAILRLLQQNARMTVKEIADIVHLSTTPVHERIKWLEQSGVIKQYAALIDQAKVKKGLMVIVYVSVVANVTVLRLKLDAELVAPACRTPLGV